MKHLPTHFKQKKQLSEQIASEKNILEAMITNRLYEIFWGDLRTSQYRKKLAKSHSDNESKIVGASNPKTDF